MEEKDFEEDQIKKNKKSYIINILLIAVILIGVITYLISVEGMENIKRLLETADYKWVLIGVLCLVAMWVAEAITIHLPMKKVYPKQKFGNTFKITMIGQLFNNITPFASGGQLMQSYVMYKEGKRPSDTLSILTMKFVITQSILIIFTILVVLSQFNFFLEIFKDLAWIGIIGIILNILLVVAFVVAGMNKNFVLKIAKPFIRLGNKIKIVKDVEKTIENFDGSVTNFSNQFKSMQKQTKTLISIAIVGLLQSIFYYAITYTVYRTFGNFGATFFEIITTQAFLMVIMTVFPTPGAGIGAEGGFILLFNTIFQNGTINLSLLFWRIYVFYIPIILGALFFIFRGKKKHIEIKEID